MFWRYLAISLSLFLGFGCCLYTAGNHKPIATVEMPAEEVTVTPGPEQFYSPWFPHYLLREPEADAGTPVTLDGDIDSRGNHSVAHLIFNKSVDDVSIKEALHFIRIAKNSHAEALVLEINTGGGSTDWGFKLARTLELMHIPVICVVDGEAASEGFYILQSCPLRVMTSRSTLMIHEPLIITKDPQRLTREQLGYFTQEQATSAHSWINHSGARLKVTIGEVRRRTFMNDWRMDERDALKFGAVDASVKSVESVIEELKKDFTFRGKKVAPKP